MVQVVAGSSPVAHPPRGHSPESRSGYSRASKSPVLTGFSGGRLFVRDIRGAEVRAFSTWGDFVRDIRRSKLARNRSNPLDRSEMAGRAVPDRGTDRAASMRLEHAKSHLAVALALRLLSRPGWRAWPPPRKPASACSASPPAAGARRRVLRRGCVVSDIARRAETRLRARRVWSPAATSARRACRASRCLPSGGRNRGGSR